MSFLAHPVYNNVHAEPSFVIVTVIDSSLPDDFDICSDLDLDLYNYI